MASCRTETDCKSNGEICIVVVAAISQWRRRLSAYVRAHGGHTEHIL